MEIEVKEEVDLTIVQELIRIAYLFHMVADRIKLQLLHKESLIHHKATTVRNNHRRRNSSHKE